MSALPPTMDVGQRIQVSIAITSGKAIGLNITIFNPKLDSDGSIAAAFVDTLVKGLRP